MQEDYISLPRDTVDNLFLVVLQAERERLYRGQAAPVLERIGRELAEHLHAKKAAA